jgi:exosortase E/protease (VPEID-CTERM system)
VPGASNQLPFLNDPVAAQILPFVIFMASALFAQTFSNVPGLLYPWRFLAMAIAVFAFWRIFLNLPWRIDLTSVVCGTAVGFLWIATATETPGTSDLTIALAGLSSLGTVVWVLCRIAGTTFLVPLIEELFFRGYLLDAIRGNGKRWHTFMALVVTSVLFGVLHDRWLAAGLSGVAFGLLKVRSGRVSDAVLAHSVANGIIAAAAVVQSDWSLI